MLKKLKTSFLRFRSALTCKLFGRRGRGGGGGGDCGGGGFRGGSSRRGGNATLSKSARFGRSKSAEGGAPTQRRNIKSNNIDKPKNILSPQLSCNFGMTTVNLTQHEDEEEEAGHSQRQKNNLYRARRYKADGGKRVGEGAAGGVLLEEEDEEDLHGMEQAQRKPRSTAEIAGLRSVRGLLTRQRAIDGGGGRRRDSSRESSSVTNPRASSSMADGESKLRRHPTKSSRTSADTQSSTVDVWL